MYTELLEVLKITENEIPINLNEIIDKYYLESDISRENSKNLLENIFKKIVNCDNNCLNRTDIGNFINQLKIDYYLYKNEHLKALYNFLKYIHDTCRGIGIISLSQKERWKDSYFIYTKLNRIDYTYDINFNDREFLIAKVIKSPFLGKYKFKTEHGHICLENNKLKLVVNEIEKIIVEIGSIEVINNLFIYLSENKFSKKNSRYLFPKNYYNFTDTLVLAVPFNYLINLSIKNIYNKAKQVKKPERKYKRLINLVREFLFIYDLQDFHNINPNLFPQSYDLKQIHHNILYDNIFRFNQLNSRLTTNFIKKLLVNNVNKVPEILGFTLHDYVDCVNKILTLSNDCGPTLFYKENFSEKEQLILNKISHGESINELYQLPTDIEKSSNVFYAKPLIKLTKDKYILIDKAYCSWNFYEVIPYLLNYKYIDIGKNLENLLIDELKQLNVKLHVGAYNDSDRECDIVVEEENTIIFIEIKKKSITRKSISGDETQIAIDLIDAFMHSQEQLLAHEVFINKNKQIIFKNGTCIELNNRNIEKVSISLFDSYSLNDHMFTMNMFDFLQRLKFETSINESQKENKEYQKILKSMQEKNNKITNINSYLSELFGENSDEYRKNRFNIWFLSLELFVMIIQEATSKKKTISDIMKVFKHQSSLTGDLYFEYDHFSGIAN